MINQAEIVKQTISNMTHDELSGSIAWVIDTEGLRAILSQSLKEVDYDTFLLNHDIYDLRSYQILILFWSEEELRQFYITQTRKFSKWGIEVTDKLKKWAKECPVLNGSTDIDQNRKYYFHKDIYLARSGDIIIIGKDPDQSQYFVSEEE